MAEKRFVYISIACPNRPAITFGSESTADHFQVYRSLLILTDDDRECILRKILEERWRERRRHVQPFPRRGENVVPARQETSDLEVPVWIGPPAMSTNRVGPPTGLVFRE